MNSGKDREDWLASGSLDGGRRACLERAQSFDWTASRQPVRIMLRPSTYAHHRKRFALDDLAV